MKFKVEEMRKQLFGDDRNEFLLSSITANLQRRFKLGDTYLDHSMP